MTAFITIDIETLPNVSEEGVYEGILETMENPFKQAKRRQEWEDVDRYQDADKEFRKQALSPWKGEIVSICWAVNDDEVKGTVRNPKEESERDFLVRTDQAIYDNVMEHNERPEYAIWVAHNAQFDLGWISKRCLKYQIRTKMQYPIAPRPLGERNVYCTMANAAGWSGRVGLSTLAKFFGLGDKIADGGDVYDMYRAEEFDKILEYCKKDVEITREVYYYLNLRYAGQVEVSQGNTTGDELAF